MTSRCFVWRDLVCAALHRVATKEMKHAINPNPLMSSPGWDKCSIRDKQTALWGELMPLQTGCSGTSVALEPVFPCLHVPWLNNKKSHWCVLHRSFDVVSPTLSYLLHRYPLSSAVSVALLCTWTFGLRNQLENWTDWNNDYPSPKQWDTVSKNMSFALHICIPYQLTHSSGPFPALFGHSMTCRSSSHRENKDLCQRCH